MFTGIIEHVGCVREIGPSHLGLDLGPLADGLRPGASIAVNGVCLTLAGQRGNEGRFDVVPETWRRTALGDLRPGDGVNLERSLRVGDRLDGHFVQGHAEGVGLVTRVEQSGDEWLLWVSAPPELRPMIVTKGSIAIDGTSLTVAATTAEAFSVALIPTTLARTTLGQRSSGARVNLETDILARLVIRRLEALLPAAVETAVGEMGVGETAVGETAAGAPSPAAPGVATAPLPRRRLPASGLLP